MNKEIKIARIGRSIGLKGELKIHLDTDFPEQFKKGSSFDTDTSRVTIESYSEDRGVVKFKNIDNKDEASKFTNQSLYTTLEETKNSCSLGKEEYFWFDVIECLIYEDGKLLGVVEEIERISNIDYLHIKSSQELIDRSYSKSFLIPYMDRYIKNIDIEKKCIETTGAFDILEAS